MFKKTLLQFDRDFFDRLFLRTFNPRRVQLYCIGTPKSGTHSIMHLFVGILRSMHEPDREQLIALYSKIKNETITKTKLEKIVEDRERRLHLELNSSWFNHVIVDVLVAKYPEAKFIHPIRSPRPWLDSMINHIINKKNDKIHQVVNIYSNPICKQDEIPYAPEEEILQKMNLPTIEGMLNFWRRHNLKILNTVPRDRLLTLKTEEISDKIMLIYKFAGITEIPDNIHSHAYMASEKHNILDSIDYEFVEQKINKYALNARVDDNFLSHSPLS